MNDIQLLFNSSLSFEEYVDSDEYISGCEIQSTDKIIFDLKRNANKEFDGQDQRHDGIDDSVFNLLNKIENLALLNGNMNLKPCIWTVT